MNCFHDTNSKDVSREKLFKIRQVLIARFLSRRNNHQYSKKFSEFTFDSNTHLFLTVPVWVLKLIISNTGILTKSVFYLLAFPENRRTHSTTVNNIPCNYFKLRQTSNLSRISHYILYITLIFEILFS